MILFSGTMAFHKRLKSFRLNHHSDGHLQQNVAKSLYCLDSQTCKSKAKINCRDGIAVSVFLFVESDFQPIVMNRKLFWLVTSECPSSRIARIANLRQKLIATQLPSEQLPVERHCQSNVIWLADKKQTRSRCSSVIGLMSCSISDRRLLIGINTKSMQSLANCFSPPLFIKYQMHHFFPFSSTQTEVEWDI